MDEPNDPIDQLLRKAAGNPAAGADQRQRAKDAYLRATHLALSPRSRTNRWAVLTASAAAIIIVSLAVTSLRPTSAQAALLQIAVAAERTDPLMIPPGQYAHTRSEAVNLAITPSSAERPNSIAYLLSTTREVWISSAGITHITTATDRPTFFDPGDEAAYYAAGYDKVDGVGDTVTETFEGATTILTERSWPTVPEQLQDTIVELIPANHERPLDVEILDIALDLIREVGPDPALRAAAVQVIAGLETKIVQQTTNQAIFALSYTTPDDITITFSLDANGNLLNEMDTDNDGDPNLGIPPGTRISAISYSPTTITNAPQLLAPSRSLLRTGLSASRDL